ncbi:MAG: DUF4329 domain-containing protein [Octadecabacter sp.]|nr:DUF4329 domain-containing protein [Octadecabacter sp.]
MIRSVVFVVTGLIALSACDVPQQQIIPQPAVQTASKPGSAALLANPANVNAGFSVAPPNAPSGAIVDTFARNFLNSIQPRSIGERREYCGYFYQDDAGQLQATLPIPGSFAACEMPAPRVGQGIIASYHTHAAYGGAYDNEVPSAVDLLSDFDYGIDGYVSTPGGRVWLVDYQTRTTRQICGIGCVVSDPNFVVDQDDVIRAAYSVRDLWVRNSEF